MHDRLVLLTLSVLLAGCGTPPVGPSDDGPPDPLTCTYTSTGWQAGCEVTPRCGMSVTLTIPYAAAGNDNTSEVFAFWTKAGIGIADLQDESDHQHIVATGQGEYNLTQPGAQTFVERYQERARPEHAALAWWAAVDEDLADEFCMLDRYGQGEGPWQFQDWSGIDVERYGATPWDPVARAFCAVWNQTKEAAVPDPPLGGHHGNVCRTR